MFGRATITLGIGPHSSCIMHLYIDNFDQRLLLMLNAKINNYAPRQPFPDYIKLHVASDATSKERATIDHPLRHAACDKS